MPEELPKRGDTLYGHLDYLFNIMRRRVPTAKTECSTLDRHPDADAPDFIMYVSYRGRARIIAWDGTESFRWWNLDSGMGSAICGLDDVEDGACVIAREVRAPVLGE